jgi:hypothetical protein
VEQFSGGSGGGRCGSLGRHFGSYRLKNVKKGVRKYFNLKDWMEGDMPKYLILKVVRYQILDNKGLAGRHVVIIVNIIRFVPGRGALVRARAAHGALEKLFHVEQFFGVQKIS